MKAEHGGALDRAIALYGGERNEWIDLSTGINPWPYPVSTPSMDAWTRLPEDQEMRALLAAAREAFGVPAGWDVVAASGTQILLNLLPLTRPRCLATVLSPTYSEHARAWRNAGHDVRETVDTRPTDVTVAVNPNNPDGRDWGLAELRAPARTLVVVDEAFRDGSEGRSALRSPDDRTIVLRSFGKFYGLAGLRLGFAMGPPSLIEPLRRLTDPWAVSGPAIRIATDALNDKAWRARTRAFLERQARTLADDLCACGLAIVGRTNLFVTTTHSDAAEIRERLCAARILVRSFEYDTTWLRFGLPPDENARERLLSALRT